MGWLSPSPGPANICWCERSVASSQSLPRTCPAGPAASPAPRPCCETAEALLCTCSEVAATLKGGFAGEAHAGWQVSTLLIISAVGLVLLLLSGNNSGRLQEIKAQTGLMTCPRSHSWRSKREFRGKAGEAVWGSGSPSIPRPGLNALLFLCMPGSNREWGECNTPQSLHGPRAEPAFAGLLLLLTTRPGLTSALGWGSGPRLTSAPGLP